MLLLEKQACGIMELRFWMDPAGRFQFVHFKKRLHQSVTTTQRQRIVRTHRTHCHGKIAVHTNKHCMP